MTIGERIRDVRKSRHLTQQQLADASGVATISIHQYETGKRKPQLEQIRLIAQALNISPYYLIDGQGSFRELHLANGIHIYRNSSPLDMDDCGIPDLLVNQCDVAYKSNRLLVAVDKGVSIDPDFLKQIIAFAKASETLVIDEGDEKFLSRIIPSLREPETLSQEEEALKTLLNSLGYDISKVDGRYTFFSNTGGNTISENDIGELLACAKNGLQIAAKTLELKMREGLLEGLKSNGQKRKQRKDQGQ